MTVESDAEKFAKRDLSETKGTDAVVASLSQETPKEPGDEMEEVFLNRVIGESSDPIPDLTVSSWLMQLCDSCYYEKLDLHMLLVHPSVPVQTSTYVNLSM